MAIGEKQMCQECLRIRQDLIGCGCQKTAKDDSLTSDFHWIEWLQFTQLEGAGGGRD